MSDERQDDLARAVRRQQAQADALAADLDAARATPVSAASADGTVRAEAAGGRLTAVHLEPDAARLPHPALVGALTEAAGAALRASNEALRVAAERIIRQVAR